MLKDIKESFQSYDDLHPLQLFLKNNSELTNNGLNKSLKKYPKENHELFYIKPFVGRIFGRLFLRKYHIKSKN